MKSGYFGTRTILLFLAATIVISYTIGVSTTKTSSSSGHRDHQNAKSNFSDVKDTLMKTLGTPKEEDEEKKVDKRLKQEMKALSNEYYPGLGKSAFNISSERGIGRSLYRNDVVLTKRKTEKKMERSARTKRLVFQNPNATWPNGVFYTFNTTDEHVHKMFQMAKKIWSDVTCVDFVEDRNAPNKMVVVKGDAWWSGLGRVSGDQLLSLDGRASVGLAVHEIGHALGLLHTMRRYDRDNYVRVIVQNIDKKYTDEFTRVNESYADVYGLGYDYGSIMHFPDASYSTNKKPTIMATNPHYQKTMGSGIISFTDIYMINERYGCKAKCNKKTSAKCVNEEFPHSQNCSVCICPGGYGGPLCDRQPPGCGQNLVATSEKQTVEKLIGHGLNLRDQFEFCNYMITAPEGARIEVDVQMISYGYDESGCPRGGVEIKAQKDHKLTGYRFCSFVETVNPILSSSNRLPVILFNRQGAMETTFSYRYIE